jgi:hypothetical protein
VVPRTVPTRPNPRAPSSKPTTPTAPAIPAIRPSTRSLHPLTLPYYPTCLESPRGRSAPPSLPPTVTSLPTDSDMTARCYTPPPPRDGDIRRARGSERVRHHTHQSSRQKGPDGSSRRTVLPFGPILPWRPICEPFFGSLPARRASTMAIADWIRSFGSGMGQFGPIWVGMGPVWCWE